MVMANIGFAFMPEYSVTHPDTVRRPLIDPALKRTISLISLPGRRHRPPRRLCAPHARIDGRDRSPCSRCAVQAVEGALAHWLRARY